MGNVDRNTKVRHSFPHKIYANAIRIHPLTWIGHISLRFDATFEG